MFRPLEYSELPCWKSFIELVLNRFNDLLGKMCLDQSPNNYCTKEIESS